MYWVDAQVNLGEMFVHHEDVRRAHDGWEPRVLPDKRQDALWGLARKVGKLGYRQSPVTVVLERPSGEQSTVRKAGAGQVILRGEPSELALHAFGRIRYGSSPMVRLPSHRGRRPPSTEGSEGISPQVSPVLRVLRMVRKVP